MTQKTRTLSIALLGQPNSGKSTLFNGLTGGHQHVGNWPGKTVEKKTGSFSERGINFLVCDLPGAYSLSAQSDEERITQEFIEQGRADVVCLMVDASQLARSLYILADFVGASVPSVLVLNMMDVAEQQGRRVDDAKLEERLGIPVVPFVANDRSYYPSLVEVVIRARESGSRIDDKALKGLYRETSPDWRREYAPFVDREGDAPDTADDPRLSDASAPSNAGFNAVWLAAQRACRSKQGSVDCAKARFLWVDRILEGAQSIVPVKSGFMARLDRALLSPRWGKPVSILVIIVGLLVAFAVAVIPMMASISLPSLISLPLYEALEAIGAPVFVDDLLAYGVVTALAYSLSMASFVFGVGFAFGIFEEIGVVARISYVFDSSMQKLGLQGKVIMSFIMGLGCTMAGIVGTRVIDSYGQRLLAIAVTWAVPCGATLAIVPTISLVYFGPGGMIAIVLAIYLLMIAVMLLVARVFGNSLAPEAERAGLVMELPPYHKPKFRVIFTTSIRRAVDIFKRGFRIVLLVMVLFWALSFSPTGSADDSLIFAFGKAIEPVTQFFGLGWRTFLAFFCSMFAKEAALGVLSAVAGAGNMGQGLFATMIAAKGGASVGLGGLTAVVSAPEMLAFLFALSFNMPCAMSLSVTYGETHSAKWTGLIALFYFALALCLSFIVYHVAVLFL